jgi:hypothetical protein
MSQTADPVGMVFVFFIFDQHFYKNLIEIVLPPPVLTEIFNRGWKASAYL